MPQKRRYSRTKRAESSAKYIRKVAARQDRREIQKAEGKWYGFIAQVEITTANLGAVGTIRLPRPLEMNTNQAANPNRKAERGITIYGLNSIICLSIVTAGDAQDAPLAGAMAATILREGHNPALQEDPFPLALTSRGSEPAFTDPSQYFNERPWRWWQPFVLNLGGTDPKHTMAMPFGFRRGRRIYMGPWVRQSISNSLAHDEYELVTSLAPRAPGLKVHVQWFGRYRYVEKEL